MSFFLVLDRSLTSQSAIKTSTSLSALHMRQRPQNTGSGSPHNDHELKISWDRRGSPRRSVTQTPWQYLEQVFLRALVQAGRCQTYSTKRSQTLWKTYQKPDGQIQKSQTRHQSTICHAPIPHGRPLPPKLKPAYKVSKREVRQLVDYYDSDCHASEASLSADFFFSRESKDFLDLPTKDEPLVDPRVQHFVDLVRDRVKDDDHIFEQYRQLPQPRASNIPNPIMRRFLHRLSNRPHKSEPAMLRYMSVIEDMRQAKKSLTTSEWTSAISFVGRCFKRITSEEIESALSLWKEMETAAGVKANEVTFNVLFDMATKAHKFVLADMILREMEKRGHKMNRYFRTGLMYYYGLKSDGAGVRKTYRSLVEAGEIVDTTVISCAIRSLVLCREPVAALHVLNRAKRLHATKSGSKLPPHGWRERKNLGKILASQAQKGKTNPILLKQAQHEASLAPGVHAYRALIYHFAVLAGDIEQVTILCSEMQHYDIPLDGPTFYHLFCGFANHGGALYTRWTEEKLESTFAAFIKAAQESKNRDVYIDKSAALICTQAFIQCSNEMRVEQVWGALQSIWNPPSEEAVQVRECMADKWSRKQRREVFPSIFRA